MNLETFRLYKIDDNFIYLHSRIFSLTAKETILNKVVCVLKFLLIYNKFLYLTLLVNRSNKVINFSLKKEVETPK